MEHKINGRVREILGFYTGENTGVLKNLALMLNTGTLAGTGKLVVLPVDQGFEHGPARSFAPNPAGYDPDYHFELAIESGCNAYAAPYGQIAASHADYAGRIPVIVKMNNNDSLYKTRNPVPAVTCSIRDALQVGASAIGFTIYPGSSFKKEMYQEIRELGEEARSHGLPVVIWSYARGESLSSEGETGIDVIAYAAHIAAQLGAHIIKVKPPTDFIELSAAKKAYEQANIPIATLEERIRHVVQSCFNGKRIVIFSGGESKATEAVLEEIQQLNAGGAFGSIMGRNAFQRPREEAVALLRDVMKVYLSS
ncbi:class I fructose-bisphosphate aldolase [bacterium]|jgi:class I fructose-bisphosphate aldolase|nr:class I fructose-bisphosphate aldolase [bacterium]